MDRGTIKKLLFPLRRLRRFMIEAIHWKRRALARIRLDHCGRGVYFNGRVRIVAPRGAAIEDNVHIGDGAYFDARGGLRIGENTHMAPHVVIYTWNHNYEGSLLPYDEEVLARPVSIGRNVWIGANVKIAPGVTIGEGAVIGRGAVITEDVPPLTVVRVKQAHDLRHRDRSHYESLDREGRYSGQCGAPLGKIVRG